MTQPQTHEAMVISCVCVCAQASITRVSFQQSTAICPSIKISTSQPVSWSYLGCRAMDSRSCINWFFFDILLQLQLHERRFSHQSRRAANKSRVPRCLKHSKHAEQIWCFSASAKNSNHVWQLPRCMQFHQILPSMKHTASMSLHQFSAKRVPQLPHCCHRIGSAATDMIIFKSSFQGASCFRAKYSKIMCKTLTTKVTIRR